MIELVFSGRIYNTESEKDMTDLQYILDRIDVQERVQKKKQQKAVLLAGSN